MKLKPIPENTVVHTPTEAEAKELLTILHENGYEWRNCQCLTVSTFWEEYKDKTCYALEFNDDKVGYANIEYFIGMNEAILTLAEFKRLYCEDEKPQPKFKVGDKVKIVNVRNPMMLNEIGIIEEHPAKNSPLYKVKWCEDSSTFIEEVYLELYTEPETMDDTKGETKENRNLSQDVANCDKLESKELNLCELLKGHEGEEFYSLAHGNVILDHVSPTIDSCITIKKRNGGIERFYRDGRWLRGGIVMLFPSRALYEQYPLDPYTAWSVWDDRQHIHRLAVSLYTDDEIKKVLATEGKEKVSGRLSAICRFKTTADRNKCIEEINAVIEKYQK